MVRAMALHRHTGRLHLILAWLILAHVLLISGAARARADTTDTADHYIDQADSARTQGLYEIELAFLNRAKYADSTDAEVLWRLTRSYVELGQLAEKKQQKRKHYREALVNGERAIAADSMNYLSYTWLAIAEGALAGVEGFKNRIRLAWSIREHALRAIELNPAEDTPYHILGRWHLEIASIGGLKRTMANLFYGDLPDASYEEAIYYLEQAIVKKDIIHHRLVRARAYIRSDQKELARAELRHILIMEDQLRLDEKFKDEAKLMLAELD